MRLGTIMLAVLLLGGCAEAVENPRTGERLSCSEGILDLSPWSQSDSCTANHIAEGWVVVASH
jgi:hypothetical protein